MTLQNEFLQRYWLTFCLLNLKEDVIVVWVLSLVPLMCANFFCSFVILHWIPFSVEVCFLVWIVLFYSFLSSEI